MNLLLFAEDDVCSGDGWSWRTKPHQTNIRLLEALAGREHTGTVSLCGNLVKAKATRTAFVIGLGTHMVQIYEVVDFFFWAFS